MRLLSSSVVSRFSMLAVLAGALSACTDFSTTPASLGRVTVAVTDQNNAGVPQIVVDLLMLDRTTIWRSLRTSADGTGEFGKEDGGVISQMYIVRIVPEGAYSLAGGETNDKPVTVVIGQTHPVAFKMFKQTVGGPPGS